MFLFIGNFGLGEILLLALIVFLIGAFVRSVLRALRK